MAQCKLDTDEKAEYSLCCFSAVFISVTVQILNVVLLHCCFFLLLLQFKS